LQAATLDLTQIGANASVDEGPWTWALALVHGFGKVNSSSVKNFQGIDLESGNGVLGQLNLPEIGDAEGDSLQT
jgi:hypothetical protein